ncbi:hypothetical protein ACI8AK_02455 [Geodermatophilus sp. SYSU D00867]
MSAVVMRNTRQAEAPPTPPLREDGSLHLYAMQFDDGERIAYADTPEDLLAALVPGYAERTDQQRLEARIRLAIRAQIAIQAGINADLTPEAAAVLTAEEWAVLNGSRHEQPRVDFWDPDVPLVLVETGYAPYTDVDQPISGMADVQDPPNIIWLRPVDEREFLESLHRSAFINLMKAL